MLLENFEKLVESGSSSFLLIQTKNSVHNSSHCNYCLKSGKLHIFPGKKFFNEKLQAYIDDKTLQKLDDITLACASVIRNNGKNLGMFESILQVKRNVFAPLFQKKKSIAKNFFQPSRKIFRRVSKISPPPSQITLEEKI